MTSPATVQPELSRLDRTQSPLLFMRHVWGIMLRHYYLHSGSWPRVVEMLYWPIINMATWGFTSSYLIQKFTNTIVIGSTLVASVIMVEVFVRVCTTMLMLFMEEIWSRNLGHLFASPIKFGEYISGIIGVCLIRTTIAMIPAVILAKFLFGFSLWDLGGPVTMYIGLLALNGCWYGLLIVALLLRFGLAAEWMAWMSTWLLIPIISPYYPVSVLPHGLQLVSYSLPATYVFEALKIQISDGTLATDKLLTALMLNLFYCVGASIILWAAYHGARKRGGLLQVGE